jgi:phosphatidylglycerophosphate synthase
MLADQILIFHDGKWTEGGPAPRNGAGFGAVRNYRANLVGYVRVLLCVLGAFAIAYAPWPAAILLLASTLLDWIDGPIARRMNQCSIFGSGVDWFADMMAQLVTMAWLVSIRPAALPWLALAVGIELCNCIFDFATTATARYPVLPSRPARNPAFFRILDWSMPGGAYTAFGNFLWLAWPLCLLAFCLRVETAAWLLALPALLYIWCELAWLLFIVVNWSEPARQAPVYDDGAAGFRHCGFVPEPVREVLSCTSRAVFDRMSGECATCKKAGRIFWINMWQRSGDGGKMQVDRIGELDSWCRETVSRLYAGEPVDFDGYGLIVNPVGSRTQEWHIDYNRDYSTVFIPISEITPENALQYVVCPEAPRDLPDLDRIDLAPLAAVSPWLSVRQLIAAEWSVLRMDFGTIHRGIANTGAHDRSMFWISVKKHGDLLPPEPVLQAFGPETIGTQIVV